MTMGFHLNLQKIIRGEKLRKEVKNKISKLPEIPDMENALDK